MLSYPEPIRELIEQLETLPGIGPRSAQRLAFHLLASDAGRAQRLAHALERLHGGIRRCEECGNWSVESLCPVCADEERDTKVICVVADAKDLVALERAGEYHGLYHVLDGVLSPVEGVGPGDLRVNELIARAEEFGVSEVILATPPTVEGDATAEFLREALADFGGIRITRLALGLPVGADLDYADQVTVARALSGRTKMSD